MMEDRLSIEEVREMFTELPHADLVSISVDNVATLRTVRAANAELSKQLLAERAKAKELEAEVTRLKAFSEASAAAVLQLTKDRRPAAAEHEKDAAKRAAEKGDLERAIAEQRELERERREEQRHSRQWRAVADRELAEREAGRDAVIAVVAAPGQERRVDIREDLWSKNSERDTGMW